jgi:ferrous iron transport protein A
VTTRASTGDAPGARPLDGLELHRPARILGIDVPPHAPHWARWLEDIGFVPGESVSVIARGAIGGDPLVVRIGDATFALRRAEAACVAVDLASGDDDPGGPR